MSYDAYFYWPRSYQSHFPWSIKISIIRHSKAWRMIDLRKLLANWRRTISVIIVRMYVCVQTVHVEGICVKCMLSNPTWLKTPYIRRVFISNILWRIWFLSANNMKNWRVLTWKWTRPTIKVFQKGREIKSRDPNLRIYFPPRVLLNNWLRTLHNFQAIMVTTNM